MSGLDRDRQIKRYVSDASTMLLSLNTRVLTIEWTVWGFTYNESIMFDPLDLRIQPAY